MAVTLKQTEAEPWDYPTAPAGLSPEAAALDHAAIWARIEKYTAHRWIPREVTWIVEGPGSWVPPLAPATFIRVSLWSDEEWVEVFPGACPMGGLMLACGAMYRIEATVGHDDDVPAAVREAFRRLAEYLAADSYMPAGVTAYDVSLGDLKRSSERPATWVAKALVNSGAADLLRPYRRAG